MFRFLPFLMLSLAILFSLSLPTWADELFSQIKSDSVLSAPAAGSTPGLRLDDTAGRKILNQAQLMDILRDAGMEPLVDGERGVSVKLQHSRWTFSFVVDVPEDHEHLGMTLLLSPVDAKQANVADRLLALLAANRQRKPAFFTYNANRKCLELAQQIANDKVTARNLREELRTLATIADSTAALWEIPAAANGTAAKTVSTSKVAATTTAAATNANSAPKTTAPAATTTPTSTAATATTVVGKWTATRSATEAFGLLLNANGTFALAYVKDGQTSKSSGEYTFVNSQLTLTGTDKSKFIGNVTNLTTKSFEFTIQGSSSKLQFQVAQ